MDPTQHEHFMTLAGEACASAQLAGLRIQAVLADGTVHTGVPEPDSTRDPELEADDTGWSRRLLIDGTDVDLLKLRELHLFAPEDGLISSPAGAAPVGAPPAG